MTRLLKLTVGSIALWFIFPISSSAQGFHGADGLFKQFALDVERKPILCSPVDSMGTVSRLFAITYDTKGRVKEINKLFFGNLDYKSNWTTMKFSYDTLESGSRVCRRTWHVAGGVPTPVGGAYGEEALYDSLDRLIMTTHLNSNGRRLDRVNQVTRSIYLPDDSKRIIQEWRYSNNKQYFGSDVDHWNSQFAKLDNRAYFRSYTYDENGFVIDEFPLSLAKRPVPFPGGEMVRVYERDLCGNVRRTMFRDLDGIPMTDSTGVASLEFEYDSFGREIGWRSSGLDGTPVPRLGYGNAVRLARIYREFDGTLVKELLYDKNGRIIQDAIGSE